MPVPVGEKCGWCSVEVREGEQGIMMPVLLADGDTTSMPWHKECMLRSTVGGLNHLAGQCSCRGQDAGHWPETPEERRQEALQIWELYTFGQEI